ncbi:DinB family protein [Salinicoccus roseus]|uniref:DinB family protein n=1 Tax=Salinicoccus roseus TaxID=45670 RepID=UPI003563A86D
MSKELLLFELEKTRGWTLDLFEGMKEEDMHIIPEGFPNSIHWQLGHIAGMMEMVTAALTDKDTDTSKRYQKYFGFGTSPDDFDGETPATDEIEALLKGQPERLEDLDEAVLDDDLPREFMGMTTRREQFAFMILHEAMHVGKVQEMKRVLENQ